MFEGAEYHAIITKVNEVSFHVKYDDGSYTDGVRIDDERGPNNPTGLWRHVAAPHYRCLQLLVPGVNPKKDDMKNFLEEQRRMWP
eukprot:COSAG06_NODE_14207_length_1179_cov_1.362037_1_plen_85_part_00